MSLGGRPPGGGLAELLRPRVSNDGLTREGVNAKQNRAFEINYGVGCGARPNPVLVRWVGQNTNQFR
jgi:hypothetical protein